MQTRWRISIWRSLFRISREITVAPRAESNTSLAREPGSDIFGGMSAAEILEQIRGLPFREQREVAEQILEECGAFDDELSPAQIAEMERRAESLRRNPDAGIPWDQVREQLKERLRQGRPCPAE